MNITTNKKSKINPKLNKGYVTVIITVIISSFLIGNTFAQKNVIPNKKEIWGVAFLKTMFTNVDYNDAKAAINVYVSQLQGVIGIELKPLVYEDTDDLLKNYSGEKLANVTLNSIDFLKYKSKLSLNPILVSSGKYSPLEEYFILVRKDERYNNIADLTDKNIGVPAKGNNPIPLMWLDVLINKVKKISLEKYFRQITIGKTESQLILSVFFKQLDVCLVSKSSFETMVELNPQVEKQLKILKTSPGYLLAVSSCPQKFSETKYSNSLLNRLLSLDTYPAGQQLFTLTRTEKLIKFDEGYLDNVKILLNDYNKIYKK